MNKKGARIIYKVLNAAVANATDRATVDVDRLVVSEIFVDGGVMWKRYVPRAKGSGSPILKRTSHITVKLTEI
jgi:large subunit ribosomal protein L22